MLSMPFVPCIFGGGGGHLRLVRALLPDVRDAALTGNLISAEGILKKNL